MEVYQVVFEKCSDEGEITDVVEYVEARQLITVATKMEQRAQEMEWELKSVKYLLNIVERL